MRVTAGRLAAGLTLGVAAPAFAVPVQQVAERAVVQEALAIGLASNVLQSQLEVLFVSVGGTVNDCQRLLTGGPGSVEMTASTKVSKTVTQTTVQVFYDNACKTPYVTADATVTSASPFSYSISETANYAGPKGAALGALTLNESAKVHDGAYHLLGTGTFTAAAGNLPPVSLGLQCELPATDAPFPCTGGVAQDFPKLNRSIGSLTTLTLTIAKKAPHAVSFAGNSARLRTGALGALSVGDNGAVLKLEGTSTGFGQTAASGNAGEFTLFPPTPTGWTVSDTAHDVQFTVNVTNDTNRKLTGTVETMSTGTTLATVTLDRSGTGRINYGNGAQQPITNWTVGD